MKRNTNQLKKFTRYFGKKTQKSYLSWEIDSIGADYRH